MTAFLFAVLLQVSTQNPPAPATTASIQGRIVRADGVPVRRARVRLTLQNGNGNSQQQTSTDEDGRYEFTELRAASYLVSASKIGYVTTTFGQRRASDRGDPITVVDGASVEHIDVVLPRAPTIAGVITDENGDPVENSAVSVWQIRFTAGRRRLVGAPNASPRRTDDRGRYRLFGLPPGRYLVGAVVGQLLTDQSTLDIPGYLRTYFPARQIPPRRRSSNCASGRAR